MHMNASAQWSEVSGFPGAGVPGIKPMSQSLVASTFLCIYAYYMVSNVSWLSNMAGYTFLSDFSVHPLFDLGYWQVRQDLSICRH